MVAYFGFQFALLHDRDPLQLSAKERIVNEIWMISGSRAKIPSITMQLINVSSGIHRRPLIFSQTRGKQGICQGSAFEERRASDYAIAVSRLDVWSSCQRRFLYLWWRTSNKRAKGKTP
jgi:hypothetical protein